MFRTKMSKSVLGEGVLRLSPNQGQGLLNGMPENVVVGAGVSVSVAGAVQAGAAAVSGADSVAVDFLNGVGRSAGYFHQGFNIVSYSAAAVSSFWNCGGGGGGVMFGAFVKVVSGEWWIPGAKNKTGGTGVIDEMGGGWEFWGDHAELGVLQPNPTAYPDGKTGGYGSLANARIEGSGEILVVLPALVLGRVDRGVEWSAFVGIDDGVLHNGLKGGL